MQTSDRWRHDSVWRATVASSDNSEQTDVKKARGI